MKDYVDTGKVRIVLKDFAFLGPDSITIGQVARAVWEVNPQKFYDWHHAMFAAQGQEGTGWATTAKIQSVTATVLSASETDRVMKLAQQKADAYKTQMEADRTEGSSASVNGTPAMLIGNQMVSEIGRAHV